MSNKTVTLKHEGHWPHPDDVDKAVRKAGVKGDYTLKLLFSESGNETRYQVLTSEKAVKAAEEGPVNETQVSGPVVPED
jgi:hypothetical protein